jgi:hypothetical protein
VYDLHTHLLPDWETAFRLINRACEDGIEKICLMPHLFRQTKHGDDPEEMKKRTAAFIERARRLPAAIVEDRDVPDLGETVDPGRKKSLHF